MPPYRLDLETAPIAELWAGFEAGLKTRFEPASLYAELADLLLAEVAGRIPKAELRARLQALKLAPDLPKQSLESDAVITVESDDDHLIFSQRCAAVRTAVNPGRAFRFNNASHFPYVTRLEDYNIRLSGVLALVLPGTRWPTGPDPVL